MIRFVTAVIAEQYLLIYIWAISLNDKIPTLNCLLISGDGSSSKKKRNEYDAMCSKVSQWAASKANLESEKSRFAEEEHNLKIKLLQQKCDTECENMRKESEARIKKIEQSFMVFYYLFV